MSITKFLIYLLLAIFLLIQHSSAGRISHFNIVRTSNGRVVRRLRPGQTYWFNFGFTISAVVTGSVQNVTFERPFPFLSKTAPHTLLGFTRLAQGEYTAIAFVDNDEENKLEVAFGVRYPGYPLRGPSSLNVEPVAFLKPEFRDLPIPSSTFCRLKTPEIDENDFYLSLYRHCVEPFARTELTYDIQACDPIEMYSARLRLIELVVERHSNGTRQYKTTVLWSKLKAFDKGSNYQTDQFELPLCSEGPVFVESCWHPQGSGPRCVTSKLHNFPAFFVREPLLKFRPPIELKLAEGDKAKIVYATRGAKKGAVSYTTPFGAGVMVHGVNKSNAISVVAQAKNGRFLKRAQPAANGRAVLRLGGRNGVTKRLYDGAEVFYEFWDPSCPFLRTSQDNLQYRVSGRVSVESNIVSLEKQDRRLPTFPQPTIPPGPYGGPIKITVNATNAGGGKRADGSGTKLTYQWYRLWFYTYRGNTKPTKLEGETGPSLYFPKLEPYFFYIEKDYQALQTYFVDVCNTFGCRRSQGIDIGELVPIYEYEFEEILC